MPPTISKAVIPAAGIGSRLLPLTKAIPKEMLPVGDKPVIEHTVRELVSSGITDITIVVSGGKSLIQEHFRPNPALVEQLRADGERAGCAFEPHPAAGLDAEHVAQRIKQGAAIAKPDDLGFDRFRGAA